MHNPADVIIRAAEEGAARYETEQIEVLKRFCAIDCGSRDEEGNAAVVAIVDGLLRQIPGMQIEHEHYEGYGTNIVARLIPAHATGRILLNAHLDTVFSKGDTAAHPYHVEGDTAYGLGIVDCKGGVLVAIYAVRAMQEAGLLPDKEICMIFNCDEEIGSPVGRRTFDRYLKGTEAAFVFEPSRLENGILTARKGSVAIHVDIRGKAAHTGVNYTDGRSAVVELAHVISEFYDANDNARGIQFNMAALTSPEKTNIVPDHAACKVSVRVAGQADIETVKQITGKIAGHSFIEGCQRTITIDEIGVPMERNAQNHALYIKARQAGLLLGQDLPEQATGGSGDVSYFSYNGIPSIDALGPYMYRIHCFEESMRLSSIREKTRLFAVILAIYDQDEIA